MGDQQPAGQQAPARAERDTQTLIDAANHLAIRVLSYNIFMGADLQGVARVLDSWPADIICLQEAVVEHAATDPPDQVAWLAKRLDMQYVFTPVFSMTDHVRDCPIEQIGWAGLAIMSRWQIRQPRYLKLRGLPPFSLVAELCCGRATLTIANVHLAAVPHPILLGYWPRLIHHRRQIAALLEHLSPQSEPTIIAGDFNTLWLAPAMRLLARRLHHCRRTARTPWRGTRRTLGIPMEIDHIFVSNHFRILGAETVSASASDHRPVFAALALDIPAGQKDG